jgi:hypothetical protein
MNFVSAENYATDLAFIAALVTGGMLAGETKARWPLRFASAYLVPASEFTLGSARPPPGASPIFRYGCYRKTSSEPGVFHRGDHEIGRLQGLCGSKGWGTGGGIWHADDVPEDYERPKH